MLPKKHEEKQYEKALEELKLSYRGAFGTSEGKTVLEDLEKMCCWNNTTAVAKADRGIDPLSMAYNEGMRNVLLRIKTMTKREKPNE